MAGKTGSAQPQRGASRIPAAPGLQTCNLSWQLGLSQGLCWSRVNCSLYKV